VASCVTTATQTEAHEWTSVDTRQALEAPAYACLPDLIRQRSVVQVHLGPPKCTWRGLYIKGQDQAERLRIAPKVLPGLFGPKGQTGFD
jgi:hypothetical protein